jgi:NAD+ kinase
MFKTIGLIFKHHNPRLGDTVGTLIRLLRDAGVNILLDSSNALQSLDSDITNLPQVDRDELGKACDLIIVVGGDGTFMSAARSLNASGSRLLGINLGRLGFLADIYPNEINDRLPPILSGEYDEDQRLMLQAQVISDNQPDRHLQALNEIVLHKHNIARLIQFETRINDRLLNSQRSDGLIVSTPTGSTAYALSGGGPILTPNLEAMVVVPICPHTLSNRPIVIDANSHIEISIGNQMGNGAQLTGDGQDPHTLEDGDRIIISKISKPLFLVHPCGHDHFDLLRAKLHWAREL